MLNKVIFIGRLTADPELKTVGEGVQRVRFTLALDRAYKDAEGIRKTDFVSCVAWRSTAEFVERYFSKGQMMGVEGSLQTDSYTDADGNKRNVFEIQADNVFFTESKVKDAAPASGVKGGDRQ